jgi:trehalose 6-phosphate synthase
VPQYQVVDAEIDRLVEKINWRWSTPGWRPLIYAKRHFSPVEMMALHRLADFCVVSSLHDGMNLVAKEFVASRFDEDGVLLLSQFTGSALELTDALLFNPFAVDEMADAIHQAVTMAPPERRRRMQRLRAAVRDNNVYRWAGKILSALLKVDTAEPAPPNPAASPDPRRARRRAGLAAGASPAAARRNGAAPG